MGGEQGVAFGEEVRFPKRAVPYGLFGVFAGVGLLFVLTTYAAVIGEVLASRQKPLEVAA